MQTAQLGRGVPVYAHERLHSAKGEPVAYRVGKPRRAKIFRGRTMGIVDRFVFRSTRENTAAERRLKPDPIYNVETPVARDVCRAFLIRKADRFNVTDEPGCEKRASDRTQFRDRIDSSAAARVLRVEFLQQKVRRHLKKLAPRRAPLPVADHLPKPDQILRILEKIAETAGFCFSDKRCRLAFGHTLLDENRTLLIKR